MERQECDEYILEELRSLGYTFRRVLHRGEFGQVYECVTQDSKKRVAIKIPMMKNNEEADILRKLMAWSMDDCNIVSCNEQFIIDDDQKGLVFEKLDLNLEEYILQSHCKPMQLSDIRDIMKQMATALFALKSKRIIHADIKPKNIMIVKQKCKPFQVKLIDFGGSISTKAKKGSKPGTIGFMSPEIMLGQSFTEATDMWSMGCALAFMMLGHPLFSTDSEKNAFKAIREMIGQPSQELLKNGVYTNAFYKKVANKWIWRFPLVAELHLDELYTSLDDLKKMRVETFNWHETKQREQCVDLLKKMLQVNPDDRITPEELEKHPFITGTYMNKRPLRRFTPFWKKNKIFPLEEDPRLEPADQLLRHASDSGSETVETQRTPKAMWKSSKNHNGGPQVDEVRREHSSSPGTSIRNKSVDDRKGKLSGQSLPGVIMVKPAFEKDTTSLEDSDKASVTVFTSGTTNREHITVNLPSAMAEVQPESETAAEIEKPYRRYHIDESLGLRYKYAKPNHPVKRAALISEHEAALIIQKAWRRFLFRVIFSCYKALIHRCNQGDPQTILKTVNPREAELLDSAVGAFIRFRLGGTTFPPTIYYKIFTYRPITDLCASSPRTYTKPSNRQKVHPANTTQMEVVQTGWYQRVENNNWRPFESMKVPKGESAEIKDNKKIKRSHTKLQSRQEVEKWRKKKKINWFKQMYKQGRVESRPKDAASLVENSVQEVLSRLEKDSEEILEWEVDELLAWTNTLNFEDYITQWTLLECSDTSEVNIGPFHYGSTTKPKQIH